MWSVGAEKSRNIRIKRFPFFSLCSVKFKHDPIAYICSSFDVDFFSTLHHVLAPCGDVSESWMFHPIILIFNIRKKSTKKKKKKKLRKQVEPAEQEILVLPCHN